MCQRRNQKWHNSKNGKIHQFPGHGSAISRGVASVGYRGDATIKKLIDLRKKMAVLFTF